MVKCHLLLSTPEINIQVSGTTIKSLTCKMVFGVHVDNKLKFDTNIENIFEKAIRKPNTLTRVTPSIDVNKGKL